MVWKFHSVCISYKTHAAWLSTASVIKYVTHFLPQAQTHKQLAAEPEGAGLSDLHHRDRGQAAGRAQHGPGGLRAGEYLVYGVAIWNNFSLKGGGHQEMDISQGVYQLSLL